jgi:hypothetical protein
MSWQGNLEKRTTGGGRRTLALLLAAAVTAGIWLVACSDNPNTTRLTAPGGRGDIQGTLTFEGVSGTPLPAAKIIALQKTDCISQFGYIAVMGTFNGFRIAGADSFLMDELAPCYWVFSDTISKGDLNLKFVTAYSSPPTAFDNPPDYGKSGANNFTDPLQGTLDSGVPGDDGNLSVTIPSTGLWTFIVNEATSPASYTITQESLVIESDTQTGMFQIHDLPVGTYEVSIQAEGFLPKTVASVAVSANRVTDVGTLNMEVASGKLFGAVAFADHPEPRPEATVEVRRANSSVVLKTATTDSAFAFTGLETGAYDLSFSASGYLDTTLVGVQYVNGTEVDVGTVTLTPGCRSGFDTIQLAADFTSFDLAQAPFMNKEPDCIWTDTVTVNAGTYNMKFVTGGAYDNPKDYGGDESQNIPLAGTHPVELVSGIGTAINVSVATTGQYAFVLDENDSTFTATLLGGGATGSVSGTLGFPGIDSAPYPAADVKLLQSGTQTLVALTQSDTLTREFTMTSVEDGTYDLAITARGFLDTTLVGIQVTNGGNTEVGTVTLQPGCVSAFDTIQLASDFTSFDLGQAPFMTQSSSCVWTDTVTVNAGGPYNMKFVTDGNFDSPKDYGGDESQNIPLVGTHPVEFVSGTGTAINVSVAATGQYVFVLDESDLTFTATLLGGGATGSVSGTLGFPGIDSAPYPAADVKLLESGTQTAVALARSDTLTREFSITSVEDGTYDLAISATGFLDTTLVGIEISGGGAVDVGTVTLEPGCVSAFDTIQLASDFTSFDLGQAPFMTRTASCEWRDTVTVNAGGPYNMKFVTDGAYDNPKDYGGDESQNIPLVGTHPVEFVSGTGTAINVSVAATGQYVFVLDESSLTFTATLLGGGATGSVSGTLGFPGIDSAPYPAADVKLLESGTQTTVALARSDTLTREFTITSVEDGTYDLAISATGFLDTTVVGIEISGGAAVDVGTVTLQPGCVSAFDTIQLASDFTSFDLGQAPFMTRTASCEWRDTVTVNAGGPYNMKFVTNGAYDNPKDYGGDESQNIPLVGTHPVQPVSGVGTAINVSVAATGQYVFVLDESSLTFTATLLGGGATGSVSGTLGFPGIDSAPYPAADVKLLESGTQTTVALTQSDTLTREFTITSVEDGTYDLAISATGFLDTTVVGIEVSGGAAVDVGTVTLQPGCVSAFDTIQLASDFTSFDLGQAPFMTHTASCEWRDTVTVEAGGPYNMKFVTDGNYDSPKDYGGDESQTLELVGTHPVSLVSGIGTAINVTVATTGQYEFLLDESTLTFTATLLGASPTGSITGTIGFSGLDTGPYPEATVVLFNSGETTPVATVHSDDTTRVFTFPSVVNGTYDLKVSANCFISEQLTSINVSGATTDVGTVTLAAGTSAFTSIQMVGDFNGYDLATAPFMTEAPACVWSDTLDLSGLSAGATQYFKFVTDNTFDNPPDYGGDESKLLSIPGTYPVVPVTSGNYIQIQVNQPGFYIFTLDERRQTFSAVRYTPKPAGR